MDYRFVGIQNGPVSHTKAVPGLTSSVVNALADAGMIVFGWGPWEKVPIVMTREDLILAMEIIAKHVSEVHYCIYDSKAYATWKAGKPVSASRKEFAVDFESLSEDGKLLTKEPIDPVVAWKATLAACGARGE